MERRGHLLYSLPAGTKEHEGIISSRNIVLHSQHAIELQDAAVCLIVTWLALYGQLTAIAGLNASKAVPAMLRQQSCQQTGKSAQCCVGMQHSVVSVCSAVWLKRLCTHLTQCKASCIHRDFLQRRHKLAGMLRQ